MSSVREPRGDTAAKPEGSRTQWSLACPRCGADDEIDIAATDWARLCPDGTDMALAAHGDHEWSEHSGAVCQTCGHGGNVTDFEGVPLEEITRPQVAALLDRIGEESGPYDSNRTHSIIRAMFNTAELWGFLPADHPNPTRGIGRSSPERTRSTSPT